MGKIARMSRPHVAPPGPAEAEFNSPFIVAVTGHRDPLPQSSAHLVGAVRVCLHQLRARLPHTELRIMVGMAQGADLLVAQCAQEMGIAVNAVLPMPLSEYAEDFDAESLGLLQRLLKQPGVRLVELPMPPPAAGASRHDPARRNEAYARLTQHLIRSAGLLLALWDGKASPLPGGTADTLLRYLGVRSSTAVACDELEIVPAGDQEETGGPFAFWVPTGRSDAAAEPLTAAPCYMWGVGDHLLCCGAEPPPALQQQLAGLDEYNASFRRLDGDGALDRRDSLLAALPAEPSLQELPVLRAIDAQYGKADALAVYFQHRSDRLFQFFGWLTFVMSCSYLAYHKLSESYLLLYIYLLALLAGLGVHALLQRRRWFANHLLYRALAETLRARFYLHVADVDQGVDAEDVIAMAGINQFTGFGWIGLVLRGVESTRPASLQRAIPTVVAAHCVDKAWIESQRGYFRGKVARLERSGQRIDLLRRVLFVVVLLVTVTLIVTHESLGDTRVAGTQIATKYLLEFLMGLVAVLFGVWELHQNKMASRELVWQYRNQLQHFTRASEELARTSSPDRRRELIAALGRDSLMESYLWTIHRYHREHEPPASTA
jgi:hypothetical protein